MRDQIRHLENSIHEYSNFWGSDYDIRTMFDFVSEFISAQNSKSHMSDDWQDLNKNSGVKSYHPF